MNFRKSCLCLLLCAAVCLAVLATSSALPAAAWEPDVRLTYGSNVEDQNYNNFNWSSPVYSYLTETADGELMRFQASYYEPKYFVEYYDGAYGLTRSLAVEEELPLFGAFYATESNYYVLSGQNNLNESADVECYRVTKYDPEWNRISSVGLYDCNTTRPFYAGSARMTHSGKYLLIRTCHEMYAYTDGLNHQANVTIQIDMETMEIVDSFTEIMNNSYGYVSHSFNQFIRVDNDHIVAVDHGDAHPRAISLIRYPTKVSSGSFSGWGCQMTEMQSFTGATGNNYTGASVGGFEISDSSYLVAYSSVPQTEGVESRIQDIYVSSMDKETGGVTVRQFTHLTEGDPSASTPQLAKMGEDAFLLLWSQKGDVYYTVLNGRGEQAGETYCIKSAALSDCVPVKVNGKLVWYTYQGIGVTFYEIDTEDPSENRRISSVALGDVNSNGEIEATDYLLLKRYVLGTFALSGDQLAAADVNGDGEVNALDYMLVKRHVLGTYKIG